MVHRQLPKYTRFIIAAMAVLWLVFPITAGAATLSELQSQLKKSEEELARYQSLQKSEQQKSQSYQSDITKLQAEINVTTNAIRNLESQIGVKSREIDETTQEIVKKSEELSVFNEDLGNSLASLYEMSSSSEVELVASGGSATSYLDGAEYMQAVQSRILEDIQHATEVKSDLENKSTQLISKRDELNALKGNQVSKSSELISEKQQQSTLLNQSQANESQYKTEVKKLEERKNIISKEIFELRKRLSSSSRERIELGGSSYPWDVGPDTWVADIWGFYKSECTSYAAWKWYKHYGTPFREYKLAGESGDAHNWPSLALRRGYKTSKTPRENSVISWPQNGAQGMPYGHVAWVEKKNNDGTIDITEFNWVDPGHDFSKRYGVEYWKKGDATFIYK